MQPQVSDCYKEIAIQNIIPVLTTNWCGYFVYLIISTSRHLSLFMSDSWIILLANHLMMSLMYSSAMKGKQSKNPFKRRKRGRRRTHKTHDRRQYAPWLWSKEIKKAGRNNIEISMGSRRFWADCDPGLHSFGWNFESSIARPQSLPSNRSPLRFCGKSLPGPHGLLCFWIQTYK